MDDIQKRLYNPTPLKILSFLSTRIKESFSARDVQIGAKSSKGAVNQTLRLLSALQILTCERKGNLFLYKTNSNSIILGQFKIFETLLNIQEVVEEIKPYCHQIILYGSCAIGSNGKDSDIDMFIKTEHKIKVQKIINRYKDDDLRIQAVIQDPLEILSSKKADKVFFEQVKKGITLWEGRPTYETV